MEEKILNIVKNVFGDEITISSKAGEPDNWDSLGQLTLFMMLESELGMKFTPEEIIENNSIKSIVSLVEYKQKN